MQGYRSRSAFKLIEMNKKFKFLKKNISLLDLGSFPGGWSQVAKEKIKDGTILGVDKKKLDKINGVNFIIGDFLEANLRQKILNNFESDVDVILSDLAEKTTGNKSLDCIRTNQLCMDIIEFSKRIGYNYCEDLSNSDISIPRNFIRHKVINNWEKQFPNIISGIRNSIDHFNEWKNSLDFMIKTYLIEGVIQNKKDLIISKDIITTLPKMVKIRLIQLLIDNENQLWSKHQIKMLNQFIDKSSTGTIHELHNGFRILNNRGNLIINRPYKDKMHSVELCPNIPTSYLNFKYELIVQDQIKDFSKNSESVDWSKLKNKKLELRVWKEGDSFQPLGMRGHQKISDFLINQKIDRISKESQSVLTADGKIVWVCGKRISNYIRLTDKTSETATLTWDYLHSC